MVIIVVIVEGYFGNLKNYPETDWFICVSRKWPWFVKKNKMDHFLSLAPSQELLDDYKTGMLDWEVYEKRFREEITSSSQAEENLAWIETLDGHEETVRLLCWEKNPPCHRFILLDILSAFSSKGELVSNSETNCSQNENSEFNKKGE